MRNPAHTIYLAFLLLVGVLTILTLGLHGCDFYLTSMNERPFHPQYAELKPSGTWGHGYGVVGTLMIAFGVVMYSSRKRIRALSNFGRIRNFLEFHMFLCLIGPIIVLYHTTFKFGGLVAVSFWSMTAVVLSGIFGRYIYVQIPRGIHGDELTMEELERENKELRARLEKEFNLDAALLDRVDSIAVPASDTSQMSVMEVLRFFVSGELTQRLRLEGLYREMSRSKVHHHVAGRVRQLVHRRIVLMRRIALLERAKEIFHYWHVVHLPFSIIMFAILIVHVAVAAAFGYTWLF